MAGSTGLEPATSDVTGRRSNQTELTPQCSSLLRELVYTELAAARKKFFQLFGANPVGRISYTVYGSVPDRSHAVRQHDEMAGSS